MKKTKILTILALFIIVFSGLSLFNIQSVKSQELSPTGIEVKEPSIHVYVAVLSDDAKSIGLNNKIIRSKVENTLRQNNIEVLDSSEYRTYHLFVNPHVYGNGVHISLEFIRAVNYKVGNKKYSRWATTWEQGLTGAHNNSDSDFIIDGIGDLVEIFISDFYKANDF